MFREVWVDRMATDDEARRAIDAVWRIESARLIGGLARMTGDVGLAEDLAQDALVIALEQWPESGVPSNPGAWLMGTAKHRAIDLFRRNERLRHKYEELGRELETSGGMEEPDPDAVDATIGDDLLSLVFTACHPVLSQEARVALTLRLLGGLTTDEIARAFLVPHVDDRAANREGQANADGGPRAVRDSERARATVPISLGARGDLSHLQRGLRRHVGR